MTDTKDERLNLRASKREKETLEYAARLSHTSVSQFVMREALASAEQVLADRTRFELPAEQWAEFVARLDEPPREVPAIERLLSEPTPFDDE